MVACVPVSAQMLVRLPLFVIAWSVSAAVDLGREKEYRHLGD